jgi:hypothetical protein
MMYRTLALLACSVLAVSAQKYDGPVPPKPDLPYLKHASDLIPTEALEATEEKKRNDTLYVIAGAASTVKTPLASPIFLIQVEKLVPDKLGLFKLEPKNGRRELLYQEKRPPKPFRLEVTRLSGNLYRIEVDESLERGEYSLSPDGSNQVFCFQVY